MNIVHITHGILPFPCDGWGAVENLVGNYKRCCERDGHGCHVVNTTDHKAAVEQVNALKPDVIHLHDEGKVDLLPLMNAKVKMLCCHAPDMFAEGFEAMPRIVSGGFYVVAQSQQAADSYRKCGVDRRRLLLFPNGANPGEIRFNPEPKLPGRCVCLARVTSRKRQHLLQHLPFVDFIGPYDASYTQFSPQSANYLGEMPRDRLNRCLTDYQTMILLSSAEAWAPTAIIEGLMAGLDVIVSNACTPNLMYYAPFVRVMTEQEISSPKPLEEVIRARLARPNIKRKLTRLYAEAQFGFDRVLYPHYIHTLGKLVTEAQKVRREPLPHIR